MYKFYNFLSVLILASFLTLNQAQQEETLKGVILLTSRGHTALQSSYPNDLYFDSAYWPDGFNQLTIDGKNQLFTLGQLIAERYANFIPQNPHQIYIQSLDDNSAIESALTISASAFLPKGRWDWNEKLTWQPIAVHSSNSEESLGIKKSCPALQKQIQSIFTSEKVVNILRVHDQLIGLLADQTGFDEINVSKIIQVYYSLQTELEASLTLPSWLNETMMNDLKQLSLQLEYALTDDQLIQKVVIGPLMRLIDSFITTITSGNENDSKFFLLTTKQDKLLSFLAAIKANYSDKIYPKFASTVAIEIHESSINGKFYNFNYLDNPEKTNWQPLVLDNSCESKFNCPLDYLLRLIEQYRSLNTEDICQTGSTINNNNLSTKPLTSKPYQRYESDSVDVFMGSDKIALNHEPSSTGSGWNIFMIIVLCVAASVIVFLGVKMIMNRQQSNRRRNDYDYL